MGGEGSMLYAIKSLKANRSLLKKRKLKSKEDVYGKKSVTKLNLKKSTAKDIIRIQRLMAIQKKRSLRTGWIAFGLMLGVIYLFYLFLT